MATTKVDDATRQRLKRLIESDEQCAAYWNELTGLTETIASSLKAAERHQLPEGFHIELKQAVRGPTAKPSRKSRPLSWLLKPAIALTLIAATLFLSQPFLAPPPSVSGNERPIASAPSKPAFAPHSWAALRSNQDPPSTLSTPPRTLQPSQRTPSMAWAGRNTLIEALDL